MNNKIFLHKTDKKATTYLGKFTFLSPCLSICLLGSSKTPNTLSILPPQSSTFRLGTVHTLPPFLLGCFQSTCFWVIWHWYMQWKLKGDVLRHQPMFLKNILLWKYLYLLLPITNLPLHTAFLSHLRCFVFHFSHELFCFYKFVFNPQECLTLVEGILPFSGTVSEKSH